MTDTNRDAKRIHVENVVKQFRKAARKARPKAAATKFHVVQGAYDDILDMQNRGFTLEEIAETLCESGVDINLNTLKAYLVRIKRVSRQSHPPRSPRRPSRGQPEGSGTSPVAEAGAPAPKGSNSAADATEDAGSFEIRPDRERFR